MVGGWKPGEGNRSSLIGSLIVGVHDGDSLVYAGHVGTGFTEQMLQVLTARLARCAGAHLRSVDQPVPPEHARRAVWASLSSSSRSSSRSGPARGGSEPLPTWVCDDRTTKVIREQ